MLVAQLAFRGMPLAKQIRLHEFQDSDGLELQQTVVILVDAIQSAHARCELRVCLKERLDEASCILPDEIWAHRNIALESTLQTDRRMREHTFHDPRVFECVPYQKANI
ncbi:MAG TPA: hypothetical protein VIN38_09455 [Thiobacillus sp.]